MHYFVSPLLSPPPPPGGLHDVRRAALPYANEILHLNSMLSEMAMKYCYFRGRKIKINAMFTAFKINHGTYQQSHSVRKKIL
jgi:hypothetical protein